MCAMFQEAHLHHNVKIKLRSSLQDPHTLVPRHSITFLRVLCFGASLATGRADAVFAVSNVITVEIVHEREHALVERVDVRALRAPFASTPFCNFVERHVGVGIPDGKWERNARTCSMKSESKRVSERASERVIG